jgi:hypothetical protein
MSRSWPIPRRARWATSPVWRSRKTSAPSSRRSASRWALAEATTRAPRPRASCTSRLPTPPAAPWTSSHSPGLGSSRSSSCTAVAPASGREAASTAPRPGGRGPTSPHPARPARHRCPSGCRAPGADPPPDHRPSSLQRHRRPPGCARPARSRPHRAGAPRPSPGRPGCRRRPGSPRPPRRRPRPGRDGPRGRKLAQAHGLGATRLVHNQRAHHAGFWHSPARWRTTTRMPAMENEPTTEGVPDQVIAGGPAGGGPPGPGCGRRRRRTAVRSC